GRWPHARRSTTSQRAGPRRRACASASSDESCRSPSPGTNTCDIPYRAEPSVRILRYGLARTWLLRAGGRGRGAGRIADSRSDCCHRFDCVHQHGHTVNPVTVHLRNRTVAEVGFWRERKTSLYSELPDEGGQECPVPS